MHSQATIPNNALWVVDRAVTRTHLHKNVLKYAIIRLKTRTFSGNVMNPIPDPTLSALHTYADECTM